jgi:hypothetical protein
MTSKLWEISSKLQSFVNEIAHIQEWDTTDEEKEEHLDRLFEEWQEENANFNDKVMACGSYLRQQKAILKAQQEEIKRLQGLAMQTDNRIRSLTAYVAGHMATTGIKKCQDALGKVSLRKNPPSLKIHIDLFDIPDEFVEQKVIRQPINSAIREGIESGSVDWASLESSGNYIVIN